MQDLDGGEREDHVEDPFREKRDPDQDHDGAGAGMRADNQQKARDAGRDGRRQNEPPEGDPELLRVERGLDFQQGVRENVDADQRADKIQHEVGAEQQNEAQRDGQNSESQIVLKRKPVQILGKISDTGFIIQDRIPKAKIILQAITREIILLLVL